MSYGMSYNEFWHGDPWLAYYYRNAYIERRKAENYRDWLLGAYFYNAVSAALANGFSKKGARRVNYIEEPFQIFPLTKEERKAKERAEQEKGMAALRAMQKQQRAKKAREMNNARNNDSGITNSPADQGTNSGSEEPCRRAEGTV